MYMLLKKESLRYSNKIKHSYRTSKFDAMFSSRRQAFYDADKQDGVSKFHIAKIRQLGPGNMLGETDAVLGRTYSYKVF